MHPIAPVLLDLDREFGSADAPLAIAPGGDHMGEVRMEHRAVLQRSERYAFAVRRLLPELDPGSDAANAADLIACSSFFAAGKVYRALFGLAHQPRLDPRDALASAAVAVEALDRSRDAWLRLLEAGLVNGAAVGDLLADLAQVREALVAAFPDPNRPGHPRVAGWAAGFERGERVQNKRPEG